MAEASFPSQAVLDAIAEAGRGILQTKYTFFAAYSVAVYDHLLTLDIEVEHIWSRRFNLVSVLFFLTRYYFLMAASMFLFVYLQPVGDMSVCGRMLLFLPIAVGTTLSVLPNFIIILRIYALYGRNVILAAILLAYVVAEVCSSLWSDLTPSASRIDVFAAMGFPEVSAVTTMRFCVVQLSPKLTGIETSLGQILQSVFDSTALALILLRARKRHGGGIASLIAKQGLVYYILNIVTYLTWTLMLIFAPVNIKQIMAGPALFSACVAVNRLTLHLLGYLKDSESVTNSSLPTETLSLHFASNSSSIRSARKRRNSWLGASTLQIPDTSCYNQQAALELTEMSTNDDCT